MVPARRKRGRPRGVDPPMERFAVRLPVTLIDALCREALRLDIPVQRLARSILALRFSVGI